MIEPQALAVRNQIPSLAAMTYLDNAGAGLPPLSVTKAMNEFVEDWSQKGEHWEAWLQDVLELRKLFGQLIGARSEEVGVVPSVSSALAAFAASMNYSKRGKVVTSSLNFPTNAILWQRMREAGLLKTVEVLPSSEGRIPFEAYEAAIDDETAIVSIDYVSWFSGYRERIREIGEIAHQHGAIMVVDGFHALGVFPFDVKKDGIDVYVNGFYKWMCGPHGVACIYADSELLPDLKPAYIGWHGIKDNVIERIQAGRDPFDVPFPTDSATPSATAARFEWGTWAAVTVKGAIEAVKFAFDTDVATRYGIIKRRRMQLMEGLRSKRVEILTPSEDMNPGGGIVTFGTKDHKTMVSELSKDKIIVSGRFNHVRVSPHFYNTSEEIDKFLDALKTVK